MADIKFIEKASLENIFQMESGYVLDFSNSSFQQFCLEELGYDVYKKYPNLSKAKILREIFLHESNTYVGKLINDLLRYKKERLSITNQEQKDFDISVEIAKRLLGKQSNELKKEKTIVTNKSYDYKVLSKELLTITNIDNAQTRGYAFEKYLVKLFSEFDLTPRSSFKIKGEQIDGSLLFNNELYIIEAKWQSKEIDVDEFRIFSDKIELKSGFTRGIFISFSNFKPNVFVRYNNNKSRFFIITVQELFVMFEREIDFNNVLMFKLRALTEEGLVLKNIIGL